MSAAAELPVTKSTDAWPETDASLLEEGRPALPAFPLQSLPPWWRAWVSETALGADAPVDYIVQALLASLAGVCGAGVVAQITETWHEPMSLWQAPVGRPSNGKTPALVGRARPPRAGGRGEDGARRKARAGRDRPRHAFRPAARGGEPAAGGRALVARRAC